MPLKVSTSNWKLTCKTIHSDTQVIQTVPIGKYTFKHKTVQYIKIFHGTEGYKAESVPGEVKTRHFLPLKRRREEVVLKPNKLILSTILFQTPSVKAHISCVDLLRTLELSDKLPGKYNQWRSLASRHILELKDKTGWKPLEVCIESYLKETVNTAWKGYWRTSSGFCNTNTKNNLTKLSSRSIFEFEWNWQCCEGKEGITSQLYSNLSDSKLYPEGKRRH